MRRTRLCFVLVLVMIANFMFFGQTYPAAAGPISSTWYFAEGYTGPGFDTWLTLQNPNATDASATITYMYRNGGTSVKNKTVPAASRETIYVNDDAGSNKEVSIKVESTQPIIAERPMYFNYQNKWTDGHVGMGATSASGIWYFAEGYTGAGFDTWLTLQNPSGTPTTATVTYLFKGGGTSEKQKTIPAESRETISVNDDVGSDKEVSIKVESPQPIIAERPMYFNYQNQWDGGHNTMGATSPNTSWCFAEGYTGPGFDTWLTLQNPNAADASVLIEYYWYTPSHLYPYITSHTVPAHSRETIYVNGDAAAERDVYLLVTSSQPIIAERSMYFNYQNKWKGGHASIGSSWNRTWYFAEGYTGDGFDTWLTLKSPWLQGDTPVTITYMFKGGGTLTKHVVVPWMSRATVNVNDDAGTNKEVSIKVECDNLTDTIVAERSMYFNYQDKWTGGHNTVGYAP